MARQMWRRGPATERISSGAFSGPSNRSQRTPKLSMQGTPCHSVRTVESPRSGLQKEWHGGILDKRLHRQRCLQSRAHQWPNRFVSRQGGHENPKCRDFKTMSQRSDHACVNNSHQTCPTRTPAVDGWISCVDAQLNERLSCVTLPTSIA